jgi:hypothetical protein
VVGADPNDHQNHLLNLAILMVRGVMERVTSKRKGKQPMEKESRCKGNNKGKGKEAPRDSGLGVSRGSSGKRSSRGRRSMVDASRVELLEDVRDMARAKKELLL